MNSAPPLPSEADVLRARGPKNRVDSRVPWAAIVEPECAAGGEIVQVATIFLTNRECPLRCLMCDLWKNTTDEPVPPGAIPAQIDNVLARLPLAQHIKLYNSGNFFDPLAIPLADHAAIAERIRGFEHVIVENHPRMCGRECVRFRERLAGSLEVALGLETVHPQVLPALHKRMTLADFDRAVEFLTGSDISVRAFILLRPPLLTEEEGVEWAIRSIEHAFDVGVGCCSVIPTRAGNGIMDELARDGRFAPPTIVSLEHVLAAGIEMNCGRVFADLWDAERLASCPRCSAARIERLAQMNLSQRVLPRIECDCEAAS
jgi:radical SAM enzyme (TIGR01210 family)